MDTLFIVNPAAGGGGAQRIWHRLSARALELFPDALVVYTRGADHAQVIATKNPHKRLIVVGGDGTFHEALQGAVPGRCEMGVLPAGSGNDLARALGLPADPARALEVLGERKVRSIDLGRIGHEYFVNGAGIGYDAVVTRDVNRDKGLLRGRLAYLGAILKHLLFYRGVEVSIEGDACSFEGRILCLTAGNGPFLGGGIPVVPRARIDDGALDFALIEDIGIAKRVRYLRRVLTGRHEGESFVRMFRARSLTVRASRDMVYHQDGEVFSGRTVTFETCPGALRVLAGGGSQW